MKLIPIHSVDPSQLPYDYSVRSVVYGFGCDHNHQVVWQCGVGHTELWWRHPSSGSGNGSSGEPYEADLMAKFKRLAKAHLDHFSRKVVQYTSVHEITIHSPIGEVRVIDLEDKSGSIRSYVYAESVQATERIPFIQLCENARACDEKDIFLGASEKYRPQRRKPVAA